MTRKTMQKKLIQYGVGLAAAVAPLAAFAQFTGQTLPSTPATDLNFFINVVCGVAGWLFIFLVVLAIIFVVLAAFNYLTSGGDPEKVKTASNQLIYAAVAIAVGLFAKALPLLVGSLVGSTATQLTQC
ncbi:MAG: hypothetical protein RL681_519 [Candidatus Parcubacteria bacterium]